MSSDATPRLGLPDMPETPELYPDLVADAFTRLDAFTDLYLKGRYVNTPPASPADGDAYLTGANPTGAWSGYPYKIATCRDGGWTMLTPFNGLRAYVAGANAFIVYADGAWLDWNSMIGAGEANIASAATCDIGAAGSLFLHVTGNTAITSFGAGTNRLRFLRFAQALTLTHNATSLILPTGANIATASGDTAIFASDGSGNWRCLAYSRASGQPVATALSAASLQTSGAIGAGVSPGAGGSKIAADGPIRSEGTTGGGAPRLQLLSGGFWTWNIIGNGNNLEFRNDSNLGFSYNASTGIFSLNGRIILANGGWIAGGGATGTGIAFYGSSVDTNGYNLYNSYFGPNVDNVSALGQAGQRWSVVYAATGSINTSDEREKKWRGGLTEAEFAAGKAIFAELGGFQFLASIAEKGEARARLHWGARAQQVAAILEAQGLNPAAYAFICHDAWDEIAAMPAEMDGEEIVRPAIPARPAGDRWGLRYEELIVFLLAVLDRRLSALEA